MRTLGLVSIAITGLGLTGCSQISNVFKKKPHYHTADGTAVYVDANANLRTSPQQAYQFADQSYDVDIYDSASQYTGYSVELYNNQPTYIAAFTDPRDTEFVSLNGTSEPADWRNCETSHRGYLYASETDYRLDPDFEVCMRNKGYVMTSESGPTTKKILSAQTVGLRGVVQPSYTTSSYPSSTTASYPSYY